MSKSGNAALFYLTMNECAVHNQIVSDIYYQPYYLISLALWDFICLFSLIKME